MEEIKVGNYIRTKQWGIAKINMISNGKCIQIKNRNNRLTSYFEQIGRTSPNIIDLIEVGDYVNGEKVTNADNYGGIYTIEWEYGNVYTTEIINDKFIKSIVTKEQFKNISYEV